MKYSFFHRSYTARVKIQNWNHFKFIFNGKYTLSKAYLTANTRDGNLNNVFLINESKVIYSVHDFEDLCLRKSSSAYACPTPLGSGRKIMKKFMYRQMAKKIKSEDKLQLKLRKIEEKISSSPQNISFPHKPLLGKGRKLHLVNGPKYSNSNLSRTVSYDKLVVNTNNLIVNKFSKENLLMKNFNLKAKEVSKKIIRNYSFIVPLHNDFSSLMSSTDNSSESEIHSLTFI
mmetsp:Transcript_20117/g.17815  ORF Transcript_20117/g.17815 Transcript_20117/m.17815 type:complete len:230 (-) Transcript_20117:998-1687(-)